MEAAAAKSCDTNRQVSSSIVRSTDGSSSNNKSISYASFSASGRREISAAVTVGEKKRERLAMGAEPQQDRDLRSIFDSVDEDSDGRITNLELADFMKKLNLAGSTDHIQSILESADENGDGVLEYSEFVKLFHSLKTLDCNQTHADEDEQELLDAFNVFDSNSDGFISPSELQSVVQCFNVGKSVKNCSHMIKAVDKDGDGLVNFQEFKEMMLSNFKSPI